MWRSLPSAPYLFVTVVPGVFIIDENNYLVNVIAVRQGHVTVANTAGLSPSRELAFFDPAPRSRAVNSTPVASTAPPLYRSSRCSFLLVRLAGAGGAQPSGVSGHHRPGVRLLGSIRHPHFYGLAGCRCVRARRLRDGVRPRSLASRVEHRVVYRRNLRRVPGDRARAAAHGGPGRLPPRTRGRRPLSGGWLHSARTEANSPSSMIPCGQPSRSAPFLFCGLFTPSPRPRRLSRGPSGIRGSPRWPMAVPHSARPFEVHIDLDPNGVRTRRVVRRRSV